MNARFAVLIMSCGAFLLCLGCRERPAGWAGKIEEQDGVVVVKNPGDPVYDGQVVTFEEELSIGQDAGQEEYLFARVAGIDADDEGHIYAIDSRDAHIRVFDGNGGFLRTIGRKGQGPGEFQMPVHVQVTADGELFVGDYAAMRGIYLSLDGHFIRQKPLPRPIQPIKLDTRGCLVGIEISAPPPIGGKTIWKYDADFAPLQTIAIEEPGA